MNANSPWFNDFCNSFLLSKDPGASILYSSRYSLEQLELKQAQLIQVISETFESDAKNWCLAKKDKQPPTENEKILLEELSIVNEAIIFTRNDLQNNPDARLTWRWLAVVVDWFSSLVESAISTPTEDLTAFWTLDVMDSLHIMPIRDKMKAIADAGFMTKVIYEQLTRLEKVLHENKEL